MSFIFDEIFSVIEGHLDNISVTTEYALISALSDAGVEPFNQFNLSNARELFQAHFLVKHCLYRLQDTYYLNGLYRLDISLTRISRIQLSSSHGFASEALKEFDHTKEYYLDIKNYFDTGEEEVTALLNNFWKKFLAAEDTLSALQVLELPANSNYADVKRRYRSLAQKSHPDKGGCAERFREITSAKKLLDTYFSAL